MIYLIWVRIRIEGSDDEMWTRARLYKEFFDLWSIGTL